MAGKVLVVIARPPAGPPVHLRKCEMPIGLSVDKQTGK